MLGRVDPEHGTWARSQCVRFGCVVIYREISLEDYYFLYSGWNKLSVGGVHNTRIAGGWLSSISVCSPGHTL